MKVLICILLLSYSFSETIQKNIEETQNVNDAWKLNLLFIGGGLLPLGQLENNKPFKALSLFGMKAYWLNQLNKSKDRDDISDRNRSFWWLLFLSFYGIIDAYVDSHMEDFPNNLDNKNNNMENK